MPSLEGSGSREKTLRAGEVANLVVAAVNLGKAALADFTSDDKVPNRSIAFASPP